MERVAALLADRVVQALFCLCVARRQVEAEFDKQCPSERSEESLLTTMKEEVEKVGGNIADSCLACPEQTFGFSGSEIFAPLCY